MNNIYYVGMYDIGDEEFTLGKENTVEVPETGDILTVVQKNKLTGPARKMIQSCSDKNRSKWRKMTRS